MTKSKPTDSAITKTKLVNLIAKRTGKKQSEVKFILDTTLNAIFDSCIEAGGCEISGFGKFYTVEIKGRTGYNFKTKGPVQIAPYRKMRFIPAGAWDVLSKVNLEEDDNEAG